MFDALYRLFSHDLAIDLGTANTLVLIRNQGIKIAEPSVIALNSKTNEIVAVGKKALPMLGKTPPDINAIRPLKDGVIQDFEATVKMLLYYIKNLHSDYVSRVVGPRPLVVVGIPSEITEVERRAVIKSFITAGARQCYLIDEPMVAAIGAGMKITEPSGSFVVDIGGGTTEIALISLGGIVVGRSIKIAGEEIDRNICDFAKKKFELLVGESTAEKCKIEIGAAIIGYKAKPPEQDFFIISGREISSGLPRAANVTSDNIAEAVNPSLKIISRNTKDILEEAPPELVSDVQKKGIMFAGGGSKLRGIANFFEEEIGVKVYIAQDPQTCVVRGCGFLLENPKLLKRLVK